MSKRKPVHVPTVAELAETGLAKLSKDGKAYKIKPKGLKLIADAQAHNATIEKPINDEINRLRQALKKAEARRQAVAASATRWTVKNQAKVKKTADNNGELWTLKELEIVDDRSLSASEVARRLGRTPYAVKAQRKFLNRKENQA